MKQGRNDLNTSSSVSFSPRVVSKWRNSAELMYPFPSLSKWRRPSIKSSAVSALLDFEICWNKKVSNQWFTRRYLLFSPKLIWIKTDTYLINRKKHFERNTFIWFMLMSVFLHIRLGRVLSESPQCVPNLSDVNFTIASIIKKLEGLLKF